MEEYVCHRAITIIGPQSKVCCTGCTWPPTQNSASGKGEGQRKHSSPHNFQVSSHSCRYWWWLVISLWQIDFFINFFILLSLTRKNLLSLQQPVAQSYLVGLIHFVKDHFLFFALNVPPVAFSCAPHILHCWRSESSPFTLTPVF